MSTQREKAQLLRSLHRPGDPLVLVNVWDAVSARIVEELGFPAIATTSAGIAWVEGFPDGEACPRERMLEAVRRVCDRVNVPVTADLESGYGPSIDDAVATARGEIAAGAVGLNFEDWDPRLATLADVALHLARIAAIRAAGDAADVPLVINARTDVYLHAVGDSDAWRLAEATRRCNLYLEAGADCAFVPGVADEATIEALVKAIDGPINILAGPATPSVARLAQLGVARISLGSSAIAVALAKFRDLATHVRDHGTFEGAASRITYADANKLFS